MDVAPWEPDDKEKRNAYLDSRRGEVTLRLLGRVGNDGKLLPGKKLNLVH